MKVVLIGRRIFRFRCCSCLNIYARKWYRLMALAHQHDVRHAIRDIQIVFSSASMYYFILVSHLQFIGLCSEIYPGASILIILNIWCTTNKMMTDSTRVATWMLRIAYRVSCIIVCKNHYDSCTLDVETFAARQNVTP